MKYLLFLLLVLAIFIIAVTFGMHNNQLVNFDYLLASGEYRLSSLLVSLFTLGLLIGWAISGIFYLRTRLRLYRCEKMLTQLRDQINKTLPTDKNTGTPVSLPPQPTVKE